MSDEKQPSGGQKMTMEDIEARMEAFRFAMAKLSEMPVFTVSQRHQKSRAIAAIRSMSATWFNRMTGISGGMTEDEQEDSIEKAFEWRGSDGAGQRFRSDP